MIGTGSCLVRSTGFLLVARAAVGAVTPSRKARRPQLSLGAIDLRSGLEILAGVSCVQAQGNTPPVEPRLWETLSLCSSECGWPTPGARAPRGTGAADPPRRLHGCSPGSPGAAGTCSRASSCRCAGPAIGFPEAPRASTTAWYSKHRLQQKPRYTPISVWAWYLGKKRKRTRCKRLYLFFPSSSAAGGQPGAAQSKGAGPEVPGQTGL